MSIEIYFSSSHRKGDSIEKKNEFNKEITELTLIKFNEVSIILEKQNIFFFFEWMRYSYIQSLGRLIIKNFPGYERFICTKAHLQIEFPNFSDFEFIIFMSREVRDSNSKIFKVLTIAHELQHVLQFINNKEAYFRISVLKAYFCAMNKFTNIFYRNLPSEIDAFRKSKIIAKNIFREPEINKFLNEEIKDAQENVEKNYWENIKSLSDDLDYNFKDETFKLWNKYENDITNKIKELKNNKQADELDIKELDFIESVELLDKIKTTESQ